MAVEPHIPSIANVIQLSIAPVFMLTAIGSFLVVLTNRLGRAVDRAREIEDELDGLVEEPLAIAKDELHVLSRRVRWLHRAINSCTICALLVCLEIAALFGGAFLDINVTTGAGWVFVLAMVALTFGLIAFLREVALATHHLRIGSHRPGF